MQGGGKKKMQPLKTMTAYLVSVCLALSGCVTSSGSGSGSSVGVGPQLSSFFGKQDHSAEPDRPKLDVIIPVFDPGLPEDETTYDEEGVWPELRRAEANRFAVKMKEALEATGAFGAVRVTPDKAATGDLYVIGRIVESNGEEVEIAIEVFDVSGKKWMDDTFDHEVAPEFHKNIRNKGKDPYDPVFAEAAKEIVEELNDHDTAELGTIRQLADLRFGASFSDQAFARHMKTDGGQVKLVSMPADDDPMLRRTRAIRVRDQLFVDGLQAQYQSFSQGMDASYSMWQEQSLQEVIAEREANQKAAGEAIMGVLLIGAAVLAAAAGARSDSYTGSTAGLAGAAVAGVGGAMMLSKSFQTSDEAKIHRDALNELGQSVDMELAPQVVQFEEKTVKLTGDAKEQFGQWREFLKQVYAVERTPETAL
jgi:predicted phage tail protein